MRRDVLVVGGGPVGLTAALLLARHGLRVALVEKRSTSDAALGAVALDDDSLRIWQSCGLARDIQDDWAGGNHGQVVCEYLDGHGRPFIQIRRTEGDYGYPHAVSIDLPSIAAKLRRRVENHELIEYHHGLEMTAIEQLDSGVHIRCARENGTSFALDSDWVVACDGRYSRTRDLLGIPMQGRELAEPWLVADFDDPQSSGKASFLCSPRDACVTVPLPNRKRRVERMLSADARNSELLGDESRARRLLSVAWGQAASAPIQAMAIMRFYAGIARQWRVGRVVLAGDAAHVTPPFAGQGLASGLRDAANLSFKIAGIQQGWLPPEAIDTYEAERRPHQEGMIVLALRLGRIMSPRSRRSAFCTHSTIRTLMRVPAIRDRLLLRGEQTRPLIRHGFIDPGGHAGSSIPQPWVYANGSEMIRFDELLGSRMTWIVTGQGRVPTGISRSFLSFNDTLLIENRDFRDPERVFQNRFGKGSVLLVRPDRVIKSHCSYTQIVRLQRRQSPCTNYPRHHRSAPDHTGYSWSRPHSPD